jgi:hypothetical protein
MVFGRLPRAFPSDAHRIWHPAAAPVAALAPALPV